VRSCRYPPICRAALGEAAALLPVLVGLDVGDEGTERAEFSAAGGADKPFNASYCLRETPARLGLAAAAAGANVTSLLGA